MTHLSLIPSLMVYESWTMTPSTEIMTRKSNKENLMPLAVLFIWNESKGWKMVIPQN